MSAASSSNAGNLDGSITSYHSKFNLPPNGEQQANNKKKQADSQWHGPTRNNLNFAHKPGKQQNANAKNNTITSSQINKKIKINNRVSD
eukprot:4101056-Ditylum_brightwellii.AAC.1